MTSEVPDFFIFIKEGNGKGENDGVGECVKRALSREELKYEGGAILKNVEMIVQWCNSMIGPGTTSKSMVSRYF